jgi:hypothetical protein
VRPSRDELVAEGFVKLGFELDQDDGDWPPHGMEWVWATSRPDGTYELDNSPWYARGVSAGDVVEAELDDDGLLVVRRTVRESGASTLRVIFLRDEQRELDSLTEELERQAYEYELDQNHGVLAVHIPASLPLRPLGDLLTAAENEGRLGWETGHLSEVHARQWDRAWEGTEAE